VVGYSELLHRGLSDQPKLQNYADQISQAGERGAALTKKLLAFSKQQPMEAVALDLSAVLADQRSLLEKIVTARISINMDLSAELWAVWLDRGDFEDVLMNLCINAMHAMDTGEGVLTIEASNQRLSTLDAENLGVVAGEYVRFCVSDSGKGMDEETVAKIFDPFFTTKGELGTGLGLSQVYGFIERSGGGIQVYSELGVGSRFCLYFPRHIGTSDVNEELSLAGPSLVGEETIVVVDDEPGLLELAREVLSGNGYTVLCGTNGDDALALLRSNSADLLISDVIMPGMDGYELASKVKVEFPCVKILMVSGFDDTGRVDDTGTELKARVLAKPYSSRDLLERVRRLLDEESA